MRRRGTLSLTWSDILADPRNPKGVTLCVLYRIAHGTSYWPKWAFVPRVIIVVCYKFLTEYILGTEIHWRAKIGPSLRIYHGYGLVVHSAAVLGQDCVLRHGVTIGSKVKNEVLSSPILGNSIDVGTGAIIIGGIYVGDGARLGAGSVVLHDVPPGATVVGNPGRIVMSARVVKEDTN